MMIEPREAQYQWGQQVVALVDLLNDGTYPDRAPDEVLVEIGSEGEIVQVGHHEEANQPVYMVEFNGLVIGCLEEEIMLCMELDQMAAEARGQQRLPVDVTPDSASA
ncbi:MAG TPA: nitrogen fixation protein NifZ [Aquabacterium sp.]|uniref:nitrogen fixation protein NifZ n=1 Tax=Aquabacterium sp. TaxID=1872578 RepID=UPI002E32E5CD|nr:nitrogen fixation protein NifZ [Aquabacterium sp.]HEX5356208.1 nitrogen fixation protein NifZ [Aquabacterium sp.]